MTRTAIVWRSLIGFGAEMAVVDRADGAFTAVGSAVGSDPEPYRLTYRLETGPQFVTTRLEVNAEGAMWQRRLTLTRDPDGVWSVDAQHQGTTDLPAPGGPAADLRGAADCDLGRSPLTNSMPVLRHGLLARGGPVDFRMAWVSVPDLRVLPSLQTYAFDDRRGDISVVRYEGRHRGYVGLIEFDADGFVHTYPELAERVR